MFVVKKNMVALLEDHLIDFLVEVTTDGKLDSTFCCGFVMASRGFNTPTLGLALNSLLKLFYRLIN